MGMSNWDLPERGVVFWPVGNGDAVTIAVDEDTFIQVDVNHRESHDEPDDERVPVVDRLAELLPLSLNDRPRLAVLAISHHDNDHCSGFARLIDAIDVDELWITLRSFVEEKDEPGGLTDAGKAVYEEACRRRQAEVDASKNGRRAAAGNRLRVIGNASVLNNEVWKGFPTALLTSAGQFIPNINEMNKSDVIEIFIHTPFHSDTEDGSRNSSSLGMQLTLKAGSCQKQFLILGDLEYEQIDAFVEKSESRENADRLNWDVLLAPHRCSRNAVRRKDGDKWVDADAADHLKTYATEGAIVVASCRSIDDVGPDDTDPPHKDAQNVYIGIVGEDRFHSTCDYEDGSESDPLTIVVTEAECGHLLESDSTGLSNVGKALLGGAAALGAAALIRAAVRKGDRTSGPGDKRYA
jgi:beta-lactamase superfamily II metal-dependent hydrolase